VTALHDLFSEGGQSPWMDNITRSLVRRGGLAHMVELGVRGVTSNPTIFSKAMSGSNDYDEDFRRLVGQGGVEAAFWDMAIADVSGACEILAPIYDQSGGGDGFVSLEVSPALAHDTDATISAARELHQRVALPNLMVKIPATVEGVPAVRQMISEGRNINVTLIFSLERYKEVIEAYISGLEALDAAGGNLAGVHSVASFFVSRVDTEVDQRLEKLGSEGKGLEGKAAVAQAKLAYELFATSFSGLRWESLAKKGAHRQRPLWASTSTKNPTYPDLLYVESLIGPHSVNTMPDATLEAFLDHGRVSRTVDADLDRARADLEALEGLGISMKEVSEVLEIQGVASFLTSWEELMSSLAAKAASLGHVGAEGSA